MISYKAFRAIVLQDLDENHLELRIAIINNTALLTFRALDSSPIREEIIGVSYKALLQAIALLGGGNLEILEGKRNRDNKTTTQDDNGGF